MVLIQALIISLAMLIAAEAKSSQINILIMGDSLSAGYRMDRQETWGWLLAKKLQKEYPIYRIINASVSGETTDGGLVRLPASLALHQPKIVIIELGANDGLRGYPITSTTKNLAAMIKLCREAEAEPLLVAMQIPPNYGPRYTHAFAELFYTLARETGTPITPFFLEGVAGNQQLILDDGIHPTAEAQPRLLANLWPDLKKLMSTVLAQTIDSSGS